MRKTGKNLLLGGLLLFGLGGGLAQADDFWDTPAGKGTAATQKGDDGDFWQLSGEKAKSAPATKKQQDEDFWEDAPTGKEARPAEKEGDFWAGTNKTSLDKYMAEREEKRRAEARRRLLQAELQQLEAQKRQAIAQREQEERRRAESEEEERHANARREQERRNSQSQQVVIDDTGRNHGERDQFVQAYGSLYPGAASGSAPSSGSGQLLGNLQNNLNKINEISSQQREEQARERAERERREAERDKKERDRYAQEKARIQRELTAQNSRIKAAEEEGQRQEQRARAKADRESERQAAAQHQQENKAQADSDFLQRMQSGIRLGAMNCYGETHVGGGVNSSVKGSGSRCVDVHFQARCPGDRSYISGTLTNFVGMNTGCYGDTVQIAKPTCNPKEMSVTVQSVTLCR